MLLKTTSFSLHSLRPTIARVAIGLTAAGWIILSSTLCGCGVGSGLVQNQAGKAYFKSGNYTAAAAEFSRATLDDPSNPNYAYNLAKTLHKQGQSTAAEHQYRRALAIDPRHQPTYNGLASLMQESGRDNEAMSLLTAWATTQPHLPAAHIELAALQRKQGDFAAAESSLKTALSTDPGNTIALAQMGELKQQAGQPREAAKFYEQSLAKNPFQTRVASRLAAVSQPPAAVVRQASYAPAPQMIAGRNNPSFVPQAARFKPAFAWGAPPYTPRALTMSPWVTNPTGYRPVQNPNSNGVLQNIAAGRAVYPTPANGYGQMLAGTTVPNGGYTTPGARTSGHPSATFAPSSYLASPTPASPVGTTPPSFRLAADHPAPLPAPTLAQPAPELGTPIPIAPAGHTGPQSSGPIQQLNYAVPPTVPAF